MDDPQIRLSLGIDLQRMDVLKHYDMPKGANAYRVVAKSGFLPLSLIFEIRYGLQTDEEFVPVGQTVRYSTETLPLLD